MIRRLRDMFRTATFTPARPVRDDLADRRKVEGALTKADRVLAERARLERVQAEAQRVEQLIKQRRAL